MVDLNGHEGPVAGGSGEFPAFAAGGEAVDGVMKDARKKEGVCRGVVVDVFGEVVGVGKLGEGCWVGEG